MIALAYGGLFLAAFLAATVLPGSSEAAFLALQAEGLPVGALVAVATLGNTLGSAVTWALGRFALRWSDRRWFPAGPARLAQGRAWFARWGRWTLLLSWLPVVGDALCLAAGAARMPLPPFLLLVGLGKALRYALLGALGAGLFG
ncbi:MAG TPA: YqaA family protein [Alphaproteobacteria bacterium]|nr:YqaA family protein [Alphaproteobacteria bacterium]